MIAFSSTEDCLSLQKINKGDSVQKRVPQHEKLRSHQPTHGWGKIPHSSRIGSKHDVQPVLTVEQGLHPAQKERANKNRLPPTEG